MSAQAEVDSAAAAPAARVGGFAPIREYAALGDGRTIALVARDGSIDWLPVPALDGSVVFGALLDPEQGGSFALAPVEEFEVERRYLPETNVLESTITTGSGVAVLQEALTLQDGGQLSWVELVRRVRGVRGKVRFRFALRPRYDFGASETTLERREEIALARSRDRMLAFRAWEADEWDVDGDTIVGELETRRRSDALLLCVFVDGQPIPLPPRNELDVRLERTADAWKRWLGFHSYDGAYEEPVTRSALALKLLIQAKTGAIAAAPTTSLPERIGGEANWDYRYAWVRDSAFTLDALGSLGYREQVHASLAWVLHASAATHPRLEPFYGLDSTVPRDRAELDLRGYRDSRPVRRGNGASGQLQLGCYGDLLETIELYVRHGNALDRETGVRVAEVADHVCRIWRNEDSGIWELDDEQHYTQSKASAWVALDRACQLVDRGFVDPAHRGHWREEAEAIRAWVDERCWSERKRAYTIAAGSDDLDAAVLISVRTRFLQPDDPRAASTIDAIREELGAGGPLLYRTTGHRGKEGAFLACSFWLVEALARTGRLDEARATMDELLALANDVGLFSEEIDPESHDFLGNFPQGLTHLSLINAALAIQSAEKEGDDDGAA